MMKLPNLAHSSFALLLAATLLALPLAATASPNSAAGSGASIASKGLHAYHGTWRRVAVAEDDGQRHSAIDRAIAGLAWVTRTMAGPILRRSVKPPETVAFSVGNEGVKLSQPGRPERVLDFNGAESTITGDDGKQYRQRTSLVSGNAIQAQWTGEQATGVNVYRLSKDGSQLVIEHRIDVTQISGVEPIVFKSRFTRSPGMAVSSR